MFICRSQKDVKLSCNFVRHKGVFIFVFVIRDIDKYKFGQVILKLSFDQPILVAPVELANSTCPAIFITTFLEFLKSSLRLMLYTTVTLEDHNFQQKSGVWKQLLSMQW